MTQTDLLVKRAKEGNIKAIAALIAHQLAPKHIKTQVNQKSGVLNVLFESEKTLSQAQLVPWITKALNNLQPQGIQQVRLYGRIQGQPEFAWKTQIQIHSSSQQPLNVGINSQITHSISPKSQPPHKPTVSLASSSKPSPTKTTTYQRQTTKPKKRKLDILRELEESDTTTRILIGIAAIFALWVIATHGLLSLIICIALAIIPAHLAHQENKIFINWWVYGLIIFIAAIIHIFIIRLKRETKDGKDPAGKYGNDLEGINDLLLIFITCIAGIFYLAFFATFLFNDDIEAGLSALIVFGLLAIIPANTAKNKGYTRWKWWCYGLTLIPLAWIHANALHRKKAEKVTQKQAPKTANSQTLPTTTPDYPNTIADNSNFGILIAGVIITGIIYAGIATPIVPIFLSVLAIIPANIAKNKGYSFGKWWCYGFMLFIVAIIHASNLPTLKTANTTKTATQDSRDDLMKKCPYCAELIRAEAKLCRYCHSDLTKITDQNQPIEQTQNAMNLGTVAGAAVGVAGAVMVAEHIADAIAVAEAHEALSVAMDLADGAASALEAADSVVEMVEAIDAVSSAVEAMGVAGEAAAEAADALSSFGDFLDLFG